MSSLSAKSVKNGAAIALIGIYVLELVWSLFQGGSILLGLVLLAGPAAVLAYILTASKEYAFKKFLFPLGFGILSVLNVPALILTVLDLNALLEDPQAAGGLLLNAVCAVSIVICFFGTLFPQKPLLSAGALIYLLAGGALLVWAIINAGGLAAAVELDLSALVGYFCSLLFYLGILVFSLKQKE